MRAPDASAFHAGEQAAQTRAGVRDRAERLGPMFRDFLPDQHRLFFEELPFLIVGSLDATGSPWASMLRGRPGFAYTPDAQHLTVRARPMAGDPLAQALAPDAPLGVLGIQLHTRRRNRMNGHITALTDDGFTVGVDQSFGNCPQYIAARAPLDLRAAPRVPTVAEEGSLLGSEARACIEQADTCFIASASSATPDSEDRREGVDVSHRGGRAGFVRVREHDGRTVLTLPDFAGNNAFNTLGNLLRLPRAGMLFPRFDAGTLLLVTGDTEVVFEGPEVATFQGAQRLVHLTVRRGVLLRDALPAFGEAVPAREVARTGSWPGRDAP
ncbi:MAG: pyridoxamine 5'-phosphate oxidase family protein [Polyangiales bacterium]